jgi:tRNA G18 (ribose-2'-O)-methylase SpoU
MSEKQLEFRDERPNEMNELISSIHERRHPLGLIVDTLDDPRNLGMIFRLADAARLSHLWIYGNDKEILNSRKLKRVARSTLSYVPHSFIQEKDLATIQKSYQLIALEVTSNSIPMQDFIPEKPIALIAGNEIRGVSDSLLAACQHSIHIPMYGVNTSMNVAMACGIAAYHLLHKLI